MYSFLTYPLFLTFSIVLPRDEQIWVFGHYNGYNENTKYFFEYASSMNEYRCYWLANSQEELSLVKKQGYEAVLKKSFKGYWYSSRAYLTFICTGFSDVNRLLSLSSKVITFWHGTPIKKVFFDIELKKTLLSSIHRSISKFLVSRIDFYYASSSFEQEIVCQAAGISNEDSTVLGSPRFDYIRNPSNNNTLSQLRQKYQKIILFAPTWREGGKWNEGYLLTEDDKSNLNKMLEEENAVFLIKQHPKSSVSEIKNWGLSFSNRIFFAQDLMLNDINEIYKFVDVLVTDFSSVVFDFLIFNKPVLFFMPDIISYTENERGVYKYFTDNLHKYSILDWNNLIKQLKLYKTDNNLLNRVSKEIEILKNTNKNIYAHVLRRFYE